MERIEVRRVAWYSIVRYLSDVTKGEIINIGILMNIPETGELKYLFLGPKNSKFKSVWHSKVDEKSYKLGYDIITFLLNSVDKNDLRFGLNPSADTFINQVINQQLPGNFVFSDVQFAKTSNSDLLFRNLSEEYIGLKFLDEESGSNSMVVKKKAIQLIESKENLSNYIKRNIKIKPIKELGKSYTIDFGYSKNNNLDLIHSAPEKISTAYEWLERMNFITENYTEPKKISLLYKSNGENNADGTLEQMLSYLMKKDSRIVTYDIFSSNGESAFSEELHEIESSADSIYELEKLLA